MNPTEELAFRAIPLFERWVRAMIYADRQGVDRAEVAEAVGIPVEWVGEWRNLNERKG